MNKEMFLKELSDRLQILNEQERKELLEEYAQHIDLKIQSGLSEEAAVKDFGAPEELIAELLDVYHINSEFAVQNEEKKKLFKGISIPKLKKEPDSSSEKTEEQIAREKEEKQLKEAAKQIRDEERKLKQEEYREKITLWKEARRKKREERRIKRQEQFAAVSEKHREKKRLHQEYQAEHGGSGIRRLLKSTGDFILWAMLVFWKFCLLCMTAPIIFAGLVALFGTGMVAVLLWQGYPLLGITLISGGVFLAAAGAAGLILSYVFCGKRKDYNSENEA